MVRAELEQLERIGRTRMDLAAEAGVDHSHLTKWLRGHKTLGQDGQERVREVLARWEAELQATGRTRLTPGPPVEPLPEFADNAARLAWVEAQVFELAHDCRTPAVRLAALQFLHREISGRLGIQPEGDGPVCALMAKLERLAGGLPVPTA